MKEIRGEVCHNLLIKKITPKLSFDESKDYNAWRKELKEKFIELAGIKSIEENACPLNVEIEKEVQKDGYKQIRFTFESEVGAIVPCYLLIPDTDAEKFPVVITLQGHSSGFHNSIAEPKDDSENEYALGRGAFAVQAVKRGYAALAIEQRGMGESRPCERQYAGAHMCEYTAHIATMLGRTVLGERIWDISKAIDALSSFDRLDLEDITVTGNSGGGTASFYAACFDERIKLSAPSCAFCTYEDSILNWYHCSCNFIPNSYLWFEMQDLAALITPKKLLIFSGQKDEIFPIHGVEKGYKVVEKIYEKEGLKDRCSLVETPMGHWWCEDLVWDNILRMRKEVK